MRPTVDANRCPILRKPLLRRGSAEEALFDGVLAVSLTSNIDKAVRSTYAVLLTLSATSSRGSGSVGGCDASTTAGCSLLSTNCPAFEDDDGPGSISATNPRRPPPLARWSTLDDDELAKLQEGVAGRREGPASVMAGSTVSVVSSEHPPLPLFPFSFNRVTQPHRLSHYHHHR